MIGEVWKGIFAGSSALFGSLFYLLIIVSILRKKTLPNRTTWLIWWINDLLIFFSSYAGGARNTTWLPAVYVIAGFICFLVSFRADPKPLAFTEKSCLISALLGWMLWGVSDVPLYGLIVGIFVNTLGAVPTWRQIWRTSDAQELYPWVIVTLGGLCSILSAERIAPEVLLFPVNSFCVSSTTVVLLILTRQRRRAAPGL